MILHSIQLQNIRSYTQAHVSFPMGNTLLWGDIGAGKSTILHAVEFALFGTLRTILPGDHLLRNGTSQGMVCLECTIEGKHVTILRTLKRTKQGIVQDEARLIINSVSQPLTATELKSKVLELIGYPNDLLTKSKGLIFRFTVYTPQEDMKRIIYDEPEIRLNTLRRVFDIDKYQRITDNAKILNRSLREQCRKREGQIFDLELKRDQLGQYIESHRQAKIEVQTAQDRLHQLSLQTIEINKQFEQKVALAKKAVNFRNQAIVLEAEQRNITHFRAKIHQEILATQEARKNLEGTQNQLNPINLEEELKCVQAGILETTTQAGIIDSSLQRVLQSLGFIQAKEQQSGTLSKKLASMSICPTCHQPILEAHKHEIQQYEAAILSTIREELSLNQARMKELESNKKNLTENLATLYEQQHTIQTKLANLSRVQDLTKREQSLSIQLHDLENKLLIIPAQISAIHRQLYPLEDAESQLAAAREAYTQAQQLEHSSAISHARLLAEHQFKGHQIELFKEEITTKDAIKNQLHKDLALLHWIESTFSPLIALMETHVFATVYHSFNDAFTTWFSTLIDDSLMTARIDDTFAPAITQNGFDTSPDTLSGGEKTSLALAYRLSLNKVINELHTTIKTGDLIILDEPTDGFSTDQLDRVRDVLLQLPVKQCILVSHEPKIESFVDHVITVTKESHTSRIEDSS